jgi:hypothetical protein
MIPSGTGDPQSVEANGNHAGAYPREAGIFGDRQRSARFGGLMVPALAALTVLTLLAGGMRAAEGRLVFYTGFEASEGYNSCCELRGQQGWIAEGSGGNGLVTNFFAGFGQQAFIGYTPPAPKDRTLSLWRPLPEPVPRPGESVVKFSVLMQVEDPWPGNGKYDDFYWSAYNSDGQRLFSIDFDNWSAEILYDLDDPAGYQPTGFTFSNTVIYWLDVFMNFRRNTWMAMLNGVVVVDSQPITTKPNVRLNLSDMDAVWAVRLQGSPGENYLLFDEYTLTIEPGETIPPVLELVGRRPGGQFELIVHGERGLTYAIDVSEDLVTWETLATRRLDDGFWQFLDSTAPNYPRSFYRAREVAE